MHVTFTTTVLLSGAGTTLGALIGALERGAPFSINCVISNRPDAPGLQLAAKSGIRTEVVRREDFPSLSAHKLAVLEAVKGSAPDLVVLAGFMMVLPAEFIQQYPMRVLNIHPSLLPKYPGLDTHQRALEAKETEHGSSVHFVDCGVDTGPLVAQVKIPVLDSDTPATLKARIQAQERELYPWVITAIAIGEIRTVADRIEYSERVSAEARAAGFLIFPKAAIIPSN